MRAVAADIRFPEIRIAGRVLNVRSGQFIAAFEVGGFQLPALPNPCSAECLLETGLPASCLHLELTETAVISDELQAAAMLARLHSKAGHPAWLYRFDISSPQNPEPHGGATHAIERPYVFGTLNTLPYPVEDRDRAASRTMMAYWTAFARSGDPNGRGRPTWPRAAEGDTRLLLFGNSGPSAQMVPDRIRLDVLERYRERTG